MYFMVLWAEVFYDCYYFSIPCKINTFWQHALKFSGAKELVQQVAALASKPGNLSSASGARVVEGENRHLQIVSTYVRDHILWQTAHFCMSNSFKVKFHLNLLKKLLSLFKPISIKPYCLPLTIISTSALSNFVTASQLQWFITKN